VLYLFLLHTMRDEMVVAVVVVFSVCESGQTIILEILKVVGCLKINKFSTRAAILLNFMTALRKEISATGDNIHHLECTRTTRTRLAREIGRK